MTHELIKEVHSLTEECERWAFLYEEEQSLVYLLDHVLLWAQDRNLIEGATPKDQMLKMMEELGETAAAIARGNKEKIKDGIGDCLVVLTILAAQNGLSVKECLRKAYDEIKDRKGRMVNGIFIKEQDLE